VLVDRTRVQPTVPAAFAAKCFPDLLQPGCSHPVQLYITVDVEDATDSTPTAAGDWWLSQVAQKVLLKAVALELAPIQSRLAPRFWSVYMQSASCSAQQCRAQLRPVVPTYGLAAYIMS
jgi:hypothetical protein